MLAVRDSGGLKRVVGLFARDGAGTSRQIKRASIRDTTGLRTFWAEMTAAPSVQEVRGVADSPFAVPIQTQTATAVVAGGTAPITYLWELVDDGGLDWTILAPTAAATAFRAEAVVAGMAGSATFRCVATDALGVISYATVTATVENVSAI